MFASHNGHLEIVQYLLEKEAEKKDLCNSHHTSLAIACDKGYEDIAKLLLEKGANVNVTERNGETPLMRLVYKNGNESFIKLILSYEAKVNTKDDEGNTPLLKAMKFKNIGYVKILVEHPETDIFVQNYKSQNVFDLEKEGSDQVYR